MSAQEPNVEDLFRRLHEALVQKLIDELASETPRAEVLRQARELLRDNGITDAGRGSGRGVDRLAEVLRVLPFPTSEAS